MWLYGFKNYLCKIASNPVLTTIKIKLPHPIYFRTNRQAHVHMSYRFFFYYSWSSNLIVFLVAGFVVTLLLAIVLIEKFTFVPKSLSKITVFVTGNKMLHQLMAITNVLTLLSCVLLPLVRKRIFIITYMLLGLSN